MRDRFRDAMRLMRGHDPQLWEDGFHTLRPHAADEDAAFRGWARRGLELLDGRESRN
ncbi:hypothetical protein [Kutzneria kofuensis]|uniref:Uncharacterized protein n=1 Tax=Kutzneria kofuensis TaxID=103725 RepID=A0A7W9KJV2_9PSEU|nr:hypothetical protein [Kutzneria kofuensis]MBB5893194.1 hypothetical protein [Kutzneria kofuensis]